MPFWSLNNKKPFCVCLVRYAFVFSIEAYFSHCKHSNSMSLTRKSIVTAMYVP